MSNKPLYCCYSVPLMSYLSNNGVNYEVVALNKNTHNTMWIYIRNEKLNKLLKQWSLGVNKN